MTSSAPNNKEQQKESNPDPEKHAYDPMPDHQKVPASPTASSNESTPVSTPLSSNESGYGMYSEAASQSPRQQSDKHEYVTYSDSQKAAAAKKSNEVTTPVSQTPAPSIPETRPLTPPPPPVNPLDTIVVSTNNNQSDFKLVKPLGKGHDAAVSLFMYTGSDPSIRALCNSSGQVTGKILSTDGLMTLNELSNCRYLYSRFTVNQTPVDQNLFNPYLPIRVGDQYWAVSPLITYDGGNHASSLDGFFSRLNTLNASISSNAVMPAAPSVNSHIFKAYQDQPDIMLSQIMNASWASEDSLHRQGVYHLDTSSRNLMMSETTVDAKGNPLRFNTTTIDYTLTRPPNDSGLVSIAHGTPMPIKWVNYRVFADGMASIQTDLFAFRATMIGLVNLALNKDHASETDVLYLSAPNESGEQHITEKIKLFRQIADQEKESKVIRTDQQRTEVFNKVDMKVLTHYVDNNLKQAIQADTNQQRKQQIELFVECYRDYLVTIPSALACETACVSDRRLLQQANQKFLARSLLHCIDGTHIAADSKAANMVLAIQRLMQLDVDAEFKSTPLYKRLSEVQNATVLTNSFVSQLKIDCQSSLAPNVEPPPQSPQQANSEKLSELETRLHAIAPPVTPQPNTIPALLDALSKSFVSGVSVDTLMEKIKSTQKSVEEKMSFPEPKKKICDELEKIMGLCQSLKNEGVNQIPEKAATIVLARK